MRYFIFFTLLFHIAVAAQIVEIRIHPPKVILNPSQQFIFYAQAYDASGKYIPFKPEWSATGGYVDQKGIFRAGKKHGVYSIMATNPSNNARGSAVIFIRRVKEKNEKTRKNVWKLKIAPSSFSLKPHEEIKIPVSAYNYHNKKINLPMLFWKVSGGSISEDGIFKAGVKTGNYMLYVMAPGGANATVDVQILEDNFSKAGKKPSSSSQKLFFEKLKKLLHQKKILYGAAIAFIFILFLIVIIYIRKRKTAPQKMGFRKKKKPKKEKKVKEEVDQATLENIAKRDPSENARFEAVRKLKNTSILAMISRVDNSHKVKEAAKKRLREL